MKNIRDGVKLARLTFTGINPIDVDDCFTLSFQREWAAMAEDNEPRYAAVVAFDRKEEVEKLISFLQDVLKEEHQREERDTIINKYYMRHNNREETICTKYPKDYLIKLSKKEPLEARARLEMIAKHFDIPFIYPLYREKWERYEEERGSDKNAAFLSYIGIMELNSYKQYHYSDSERLTKEYESQN